MKLIHTLLLGATFTFSGFSQADWVVDDSQSEITYLSTKVFAESAGSATENNVIEGITGSISNEGIAEFVIDLSTLETAIPIRNERVLKYVFDVTNKGHKAFLRAQISPSSTNQSSVDESVPATLTIGETTKPINLKVSMIRSGSDLFVVSSEPAIVKGSDYAMSAGFKKLTELAALSFITMDIPVSFSVKLTQK